MQNKCSTTKPYSQSRSKFGEGGRVRMVEVTPISVQWILLALGSEDYAQKQTYRTWPPSLLSSSSGLTKGF